MKQVTVILILFYLFSFVDLNAQTVKSKSINFRKTPSAYLLFDKFRLDKNTAINVFRKHFSGRYDEATNGTDIDLYTVLFLHTSAKSKHQWMLFFDTPTGKLFRADYIQKEGRLCFIIMVNNVEQNELSK